MITQLRKGYSYLGKIEDKWYVIQQISMKQWNALVFSHVVGSCTNVSFTMNGQALPQSIRWDELVEFKLNIPMRQAMFSILKYGEIREKGEL